jgi:hypothetical protein
MGIKRLEHEAGQLLVLRIKVKNVCSRTSTQRRKGTVVPYPHSQQYILQVSNVEPEDVRRIMNGKNVEGGCLASSEVVP